MIDKVKSINNSTNRQLKVLGILLNKQQRTSVAQEIVSEVKKRHGDLVFNMTIPYCPAQTEQAVMSDKCITDKTTIGKAFMSVAEEIIEKTS